MKIYAHRGFSGKFPEGSRTAYEEAAKIGADGIECDVRFTRDRTLVCFHDSTTERITGKPGRISQLSLAEMRNRYDLITLEELITFAIAKRINLLIETKHPVSMGRKVEREVLRLLDQRKKEIQASGIRIIVFTFSYWAARYLSHRYSDAGYVIKKPWRIRFCPTKLIALGYWLLKGNSELEKSLINRELFLWTLNTSEDIEWAKRTRASGLITNFPDVAKEVLGH